MFNYPSFLTIEDERVNFNTDFRNWIKILISGDDEQLTNSECLVMQFRLAFADWDNIKFRNKVIKEPAKYYELLRKFLTCESESKNSTSKKNTFNWEQDWDYIVGAFIQCYKIDLEIEPIHWYKFMALFNSLDSECQFMKIVGYRSMNLHEIKDKKMREMYGKLKKQYELKDKWATLEYDNNEVWLPQEVLDARQREKGVNNEI
jgi:hypothetical protein